MTNKYRITEAPLYKAFEQLRLNPEQIGVSLLPNAWQLAEYGRD